MNIYKTESGCYINMDNVNYIKTYKLDSIADIKFVGCEMILELADDEAKAFLEYLDRHLKTVFEGYA